MKKIVALLCVLGAISSCAIYGLTNDYGKLSEEQKAIVLPLQDFENTQHGFVYKVNASQLREEIKKYPKAMVYVFANGCSSDNCKPMYVYENFAKEKGYKLFLVMVGYGNMHETTSQKFESPLFVIDHDYYGKKWSSKFIWYFENDLMGEPWDSDKTEGGSLFFYEKGNFNEALWILPNEEVFAAK